MKQKTVKSINEELDKEFPEITKLLGVVIIGSDGNVKKTSKEAILCFFESQYQQLVEEALGSDKELLLSDSVDHCNLMYNQAKAEIRESLKSRGLLK